MPGSSGPNLEEEVFSCMGWICAKDGAKDGAQDGAKDAAAHTWVDEDQRLGFTFIDSSQGLRINTLFQYQHPT